jgi:hypothetical protein
MSERGEVAKEGSVGFRRFRGPLLGAGYRCRYSEKLQWLVAVLLAGGGKLSCRLIFMNYRNVAPMSFHRLPAYE